MTHHLVLWGGFRLEPSRLLSIPSFTDPVSKHKPEQQRLLSEVARLERELEEHGAGLGV